MDLFHGRVAVVATMHGKERVIAPLLHAELGLSADVAALDTDAFGTFTRERPRVGHARDAAHQKARAALAARPDADFALASEGSFGPHPHLPFVAAGAELVLLTDRTGELELWGSDLTFETNFAARLVASLDEARTFADQARFPSHALVIMGALGEDADASVALHKGVTDVGALERYLRPLLDTHGHAWLETDMRAHLNPTRMASIERATRDLCRAAHSRCPQCARPGFVAVDAVAGIPCAVCGTLSRRIRADLLGCVGCGHREERPRAGPQTVPPGECDRCNP